LRRQEPIDLGPHGVSRYHGEAVPRCDNQSNESALVVNTNGPGARALPEVTVHNAPDQTGLSVRINDPTNVGRNERVREWLPRIAAAAAVAASSSSVWVQVPDRRRELPQGPVPGSSTRMSSSGRGFAPGPDGRSTIARKRGDPLVDNQQPRKEPIPQVGDFGRQRVVLHDIVQLREH